MPYDGKHAYLCRLGRGAILCTLLLMAGPLWAAGGADVVDDALVETPGDCHVESWLVAGVRGGALEHLGAACTSLTVPDLELGGSVERQKSGAPAAWSFQPALKYTLLEYPAAFSLAMSGTVLVDRHGHLTGAAINVPLSLHRGRLTDINLNAGWQLLRPAGGPSFTRASWGAQIVQSVAPHFTLIGEVFGTIGHAAGGQVGVRWSPGPQKIDIDLRGSHGPGPLGDAVTLGLTVRF